MQDRTAADVVKLTKDEGVEIVDIRFCDLPGLMQHFSVPAHELTEDAFVDGFGFDGSSIRGFQEIQESDMLLLPDPSTAVLDPVPPAQDAEPQLFRARPGHARELHPGPPLRGAQGRALPADHGHRRHRLLRSGGGVLHLRRRPFLTGPALGVLPGRLDRGHLELGPRREAQPRLQAPLQGGLLPRPADGPFPGPALGDDPRDGAARESRSRCSTTRWPREARPRSTCASTPCCAWPTS